MSEPNATGAGERKETPQEKHNGNRTVESGQNESVQTSKLVSRSRPLEMPVHEAEHFQPFIERDHEASQRAPQWLRPFFSLRVQLMSIYSIILMLIVVMICLLIYQQSNTLYISIVALSMLVLGTILALFFTTMLLRPLWRVTDAAQAIAIGDLKQRERLPLRLPPQDEIDRLAGSLNEMVTRLERAEELQHASELRFKQFFSDASHQLRTPLTSIRGFTEVLMRGAKDDPETAQRVLNRMKSEAERMTALINDLLTLSRLDDGQQLKKQYIDLIELCMDATAQARARVNNGRVVTLELATQERLGLQADKDRLKQLLFILLDNALKYGRQTPDGKVRLVLNRQGNQVIIQVVDNGEGIAKDDMDHIFDSFYRGTPRVSAGGTAVSGTGLGLTIAAAIVRVHEGNITAESELGKGSTFTITLPCLK